MPDQKARVGYFTFYGPAGELRTFEASEPLAYALLALLERGLEWPDGGTRELDNIDGLIVALNRDAEARAARDAA
jgi:hypothetical protein